MNYRRETNINNQVFKCQKEVYKELDLNEQEKNISKFKMKHFLIFLVIGILFAFLFRLIAVFLLLQSMDDINRSTIITGLDFLAFGYAFFIVKKKSLK